MLSRRQVFRQQVVKTLCHKLKIAVFTFKIINMNEKVPIILSDIIVATSSHHSHYTRFVSNYNIIRPKVITNFGIQTFTFISSKIWESIESSLKVPMTPKLSYVMFIALGRFLKMTIQLLW